MPSSVKAQRRPLFGHPYAFKNYDDDFAIHQSMVGFLHDIWTGAAKDSFLFVATSDPDGERWREHAISADKMIVGLNRFFRAHSRWDYNLYFCPNPFSRAGRRRAFALRSRLGWCDMDDSDPDAYRPQPNHVWETSPGRFQALWLWDARYDVSEAEAFSRALAARHGGDNGWSITKMLRIPGSINHKPKYDEPIIRLASRNWRKTSERPEILPGIQHAEPEAMDMNPHSHDRLAVLKKYRSKLDTSTRHLIRHNKVLADDRSARRYAMIAGLHEAGATLDEIASVIWSSPYFRDKYGDDQNALEIEVSRIIAKLEAAQ
jgi:hypothetical protein